ncbi:Na(+)/H(+) exchange regulatory cofactor NHE-RF3 [Electrophorus electricus]|uniref:PDZ domain-containing protein n=1 Tax=Electrophorus electricus TaxID=8005 RepID=A0A4W4DTZ9_ELEEL|nr:Na(+)/H(+) exchange regulatory cofactor NHE-RF3 [Electrophorus electricus]
MDVPKPGVIALSKREGQSYGFFLRIEQGEEGHLIRALEMGSPAELAGLKDGDRIIRVNGRFVDNLEHGQVADLVRKSGMTVTFHVLGEKAYKQAKVRGINLADPQSHPTLAQPATNGVAAPEPRLKLCYLQKSTTTGFGFSVKSMKGEAGLFMVDVLAGGVADKAGVKVDDRLVEINGENVEGATHDQIVAKVKAAGTSVMFLLVDGDTDKYYRNKHITLGAGLATVKHLPYTPRSVEMTKEHDGYGYFLMEDPAMPGHFIGQIDRGSPAERAGLWEKDRLVAVDGEEVDHCTHEQVVDKIHQCGNRCCLLVVDAKTDKMYKMGGASPLLYWEEMRDSLPKTNHAEPATSPVPAAPGHAEEDYKPKLCRLEKTEAGYGFHLNSIQGVQGQYIKQVVKGGAAERAGLADDDIVVEVNGVNVETCTHQEAVRMIRASDNTLELLVAEKAAYDYLKSKGVAITPRLLDAARTPNVLETTVTREEPQPQRSPTPPLQPRSRTSSSSSSEKSVDEKL